MIAALVHSQGYVLDKHFYCLEIAYTDVLNHHSLFLVKSPRSYTTLKMLRPKLPLTVSVNPPGETVSYNYVINFLRKNYSKFEILFPGETIVFGYKGKSYQSDVLQHACIPYIVNVEIFGVPRIDLLMEMYPDEQRTCDRHPKREKRCAELILRIVCRYMKEFCI